MGNVMEDSFYDILVHLFRAKIIYFGYIYYYFGYG
jgi:hypothetical protein